MESDLINLTGTRAAGLGTPPHSDERLREEPSAWSPT